MDRLDLLERLVNQYNVSGFVTDDPVQFPRRFDLLQDIEITGFMVSLITWGRRSMILRNADKMLSEMNYRPFEYIMNADYRHGKESLHRTFKWNDFAEICTELFEIYQAYDSLESLFSGGNGQLDLNRYKDYFLNTHVSHWNKGSAGKRLHMFLRWMVRSDGIVDIGCWKTIKPANLFIPLDTHVARNARRLNLLSRKSNDRKAVEELTSILKGFCPEDPVKYDFALFGASVNG